MARHPVGTGTAIVAVVFAALIGMVIVIAEALVRLAGRISEARTRVSVRRGPT